MKVHLAVILSTFAASTGLAQSNTFPSSGNVGVGTTSPQSLLQVEKDLTSALGPTLLLLNGSGGTNAGVSIDFSTYAFGSNLPAARIEAIDDGNYSDHILFLTKQPGGNSNALTERMRITDVGRVGIGTGSPNYTLDVNGSVNVASGGSYFFADDAGVEFITAAWGISLHGDTQHPVYVPNASVMVGYTPAANTNYGTNNLYVAGNVGIQTTDQSYPLAVNGTIEAKEVLVQSGWSDFVFDPRYKLQPLKEVAQEITVGRHLPGIPTAVEVAQHGVKMGEMEAKLLAKVEELTLHAIEQEKRLDAQSERIGELESKIDALDKENSALRGAGTGNTGS